MNNKKNENKIPQTPAIAPDDRETEGRAPIANDESVAEARDWVNFNKL